MRNNLILMLKMAYLLKWLPMKLPPSGKPDVNELRPVRSTYAFTERLNKTF